MHGMNNDINQLRPYVPTTLRVKDKHGRVLLQINPDGKVAIARFPDMSDLQKEKLLSVCRAMMVDNTELHLDLEKVRKFISFESDEDEFCS